MIFVISHGGWDSPDVIREFASKVEFLAWYGKQTSATINEVHTIIQGIKKEVFVKEKEVVIEWGLK